MQKINTDNVKRLLTCSGKNIDNVKTDQMMIPYVPTYKFIFVHVYGCTHSGMQIGSFVGTCVRA